ncbi:hypothetical protein GE061_003003 [Apolygus lucorum]|uniref:G-protein coupled receptors family 1 profile domain-containing protein n=1 Tax=Apolygus lucorum TaxID=248454 RepID=A0A8S9X4U2_APOLU|nr:hypothetical protein GE061_003003 [Apolygus lucorum]
MASTASMYLTLLLTVERSVCIFNPFRFKEWCSYTRTCKFVLTVVIFSILSNLGKLCWERRVERYFKAILDGEEFTMYKEVETELYHNPIYVEVVLVWMVIVLKYLVPLTSIITLNAITYIKLKKVNKERHTMTESQKNENKLTRMIIYVVLEFLVFTSYTAFAAMSNLFPSVRLPFDSHGQVYLYYQFRELLNSLNSSVNFITYFISWPPFRRTFLKIFGCKKEVVLTSPPPSPGTHQTSV